ncbi:MAG TPA: hypothetical protein VG963_11100 [Polyangiaceae bacterium]|nr:hypothetical protein [Polyangiaceae bacterium]
MKGPVEPSTQMRGSEFAVRGSAAGLAQEIAAGRHRLSPLLDVYAALVGQHHERADGNGYHRARKQIQEPRGRVRGAHGWDAGERFAPVEALIRRREPLGEATVSPRTHA